jgi:gamma-glutamylcyclotransferase (GGCT)/AIG2-like uncharacterized protein YtfP
MIHAVFVYGTLKRGQCRGGLWPAEPVLVRDAWIRGDLFGRHDYPALTAGQNRVIGELWSFRPEDIDRVLRTVDEIEGTNQPGQPDLYARVPVETWDLDRRQLSQAYTYRYATNPVDDGFVMLHPDEEGWVGWPETTPKAE